MTKQKLPKLNVYVCEYGCYTVTVDVDEGVTPFLIKCRKRSTLDRPIEAKYLGKDGECVGTARSSLYPRKPKPAHIPDPTHEWYKPESTKGLDDFERDHVQNGGLLLRRRTHREPVYHEEGE